MMSKPPSKSVFIGNIPYGLTEEQITDIFSSAGKVINFRLVYDRETGRPKGFGFAEYPDSDSAASAVRNLNDYEIMNRKLRVDFSNDGAEDETAVPANYSYPPPPQNGVAVPLPIISSQNGSGLPQLPQGVELPQGLSCPDAISRTLGTLPPAQLLDVLSQMKQLVAADPAKATELLKQAPQLSYAIFQALLLMGLVSTEALASVVEQAAGPPPMPTVQAPTPQHSIPSQYAPPPPGQGFPGYPPQLPQYGNVSTPPVPHGLQYPPPPQQYQPPRQPEPAPPTLGADTDALIKQALEIPLEVIEQLPPGEKAQLLALRATFGR